MNSLTDLWQNGRSKIEAAGRAVAAVVGAVHIEVWVLIAFGVCSALTYWALFYYFDIELKTLAISVAIQAAIACGAGLWVGVSDAAKQSIKPFVTALLRSRRLLVCLILINVMILGTGAMLSRTIIEWKGRPIDVWIDGQPRRIGDLYADLGVQNEAIYGWSFSQVQLAAGPAYLRDVAMRPFVLRRISLPAATVFSADHGYRIAAGLTALAFLQTTPNKFLNRARDNLKSFTEKSDLAEVQDIVGRCFIVDEQNHLSAQLANYLLSYPHSAWNPLLRACEKHKRQDYAGAVTVLRSIPENAKTPIAETIVLFRAINLMEQAKQLRRAGKAEASLDTALHLDFDLAAKMLAGSNFSDPFVDTAIPSVQLLKGFAYVHVQRLVEAESEISKAASAFDLDIKSRAFNALAYISGVRGNNDLAFQHLNQALQINPDSPHALVNRAYNNLERGQEAAARADLKRLVDIDANKSADSGIAVLARIGLAFMESEAKNGDPEPLAEMMLALKQDTFAGEAPPSLRAARIYLALGDWIAPSEKYQGLEYFAMALFAKACLGAKRAKTEDGGQKADDLYGEARVKFKKIKAALLPSWFETPKTKGFFKSVFELIQLDSQP